MMILSMSVIIFCCFVLSSVLIGPMAYYFSLILNNFEPLSLSMFLQPHSLSLLLLKLKYIYRLFDIAHKSLVVCSVLFNPFIFFTFFGVVSVDLTSS